MIIANCKHCGAEFPRKDNSYKTRIYCSKSCRITARTLARTAPVECFWRHVDKGDGLLDCWNWTGSTKGGTASGCSRNHGNIRYGQITTKSADGSKKVNWSAHRFSYTLAFGPIPAGQFICHHCDNPLCVRPEHLFAGTHQDNMDDMYAKERRAFGEALKPQLAIRKGQTHSQAKLSEEQVREIRARYELGGVYQRDLAAEFNVTQQLISKITTGHNWTHI